MKSKVFGKVLGGFALLLGLGSALLFPALAEAQKATLAWNAVTTYSNGTAIPPGQVVKYDVYRAEQPSLSGAIKLTPADYSQVTFVDTTIQASKVYYYFVRAYQISTLPSANSNVVSLATFPPDKPGGVIVVVSP